MSLLFYLIGLIQQVHFNKERTALDGRDIGLKSKGFNYMKT